MICFLVPTSVQNECPKLNSYDLSIYDSNSITNPTEQNTESLVFYPDQKSNPQNFYLAFDSTDSVTIDLLDSIAKDTFQTRDKSILIYKIKNSVPFSCEISDNIVSPYYASFFGKYSI